MTMNANTLVTQKDGLDFFAAIHDEGVLCTLRSVLRVLNTMDGSDDPEKIGDMMALIEIAADLADDLHKGLLPVMGTAVDNR